MNWELKPARDLGLTPGERLRSQLREPGLGGAALGWCWRRAVRGYLGLFHRLQVVGREHLPAEPPFVLVGNHSSHLDALCLAAALPGPAARRAYALAAGDHFFGSTLGAALAAYAVNALPVWRRRTSRRDLDTLRQRLAEDAPVFILFPEGTRSRDGRMGRFQPGLGALVAGTDIPVVPCFLDGAFAAWPATRRWPRAAPLQLRLGPPLHFADENNDRAGWTRVAERCEAAVRALGGPAATPPAG
ncbi:lysophospholipid acyltransferase family protein [Roseomonas sp. BN140053]|uniref:lysophospholipid acyltransferase family protein n=1 Tax=Roseomonas sp. BN140053 TaxID=3391898 RepID=UPI0039ED8C31